MYQIQNGIMQFTIKKHGEKDTKSKNACKDIYDWTGKYITTVQKKE